MRIKQKITTAFVMLFSVTAMQAQVMRFVYQVKTTPDSTSTEFTKTENAYLDTDGKKSFFYSENRLLRDSVMSRMRSTRTFDPSQMENLRSNINYVVEKNYSTQKTVYKDRIGRDQYAYEEKAPMEWKILPNTLKIGDYNTQEAETTFGGRTWTVWFTTDLPYQDGPYKFSGLPGLIVKAQDAKQEYTFDLMQVKRIAEIPILDQRGQDISISKEKYKKTLAAYQKNPEAYMNAERNMRSGPGGGGPGGAPPPPSGANNRFKEMRDRMIKEVKSNNNPIELK